jgi:hypothetical protein
LLAGWISSWMSDALKDEAEELTTLAGACGMAAPRGAMLELQFSRRPRFPEGLFREQVWPREKARDHHRAPSAGGPLSARRRPFQPIGSSSTG